MTMTNPMTKLTTTVGAALVSALLVASLTGCGDTNSTEPQSPGASPSQTETSSSPENPATTGAAMPAMNEPVTAAQTIFTAWARPELDYETWWAELEPMLSPTGQQAYAGTDPAAIPKLKVTGSYRLDPKPPDDPNTTALVHVPTNLGSFGLFLVHDGEGQPWRLLRLIFPEGIH